MRNSVTLADRVAAEIRAEMGRQMVSAAVLSERTGMPNATLSRRLNCLTPFDLLELERVATALGLRPDDLLNRSADGLEQVSA